MKSKITILILLLIFSVNIAQVQLPKIISTGMVLQREMPINIWGWASSGENIKVNFAGITKNVVADEKGNWEVMFPEMNAGGPYEIKIKASNLIELNDIMIGDVWICSGQSNMELTMERVSPIYKYEISECDNPNIRYFEVPDKYNFYKPQKDLIYGSWIKPDPKTILKFSALSYFFGKELQEKLNIPIGLINASLGGSRAECWMSEEALKEFPKHYNETMIFRDSVMVNKIIASDQARSHAWYNTLYQKDEGYKDQGNPWYRIGLNTDDWKSIEIPGYWVDSDLGNINGVVWFRKTVDVPESLVGKECKLLFGRVVDADSIYINGIFVGTTSYQYPPRRYQIPKGILKKGKNEITVRAISNIGKAGFIYDKQYEITFEDTSIILEGAWKYKLGAEMPPLEHQTFVRWKPMGLYNTMIAPLIKMNMKGVIWYQGESNAERAIEYKKLFPALINDWRTKWNIGDFPFLYVQLPNFMKIKKKPTESNWALMREAQCEGLSLPNTGMVVAIDLGEWNDIHPLNKKDVAYRLSLAAEKVAYNNDDVVFSGPIYKSMEIEENKVIIAFEHTANGLITKDGGELNGFSIAGYNEKFVWAKAKIKNDKVIVWCDKIQNPIAVRYAWADNPKDANLYNSAMLPASPFRTDKK